jgi:hypothetical protein
MHLGLMMDQEELRKFEQISGCSLDGAHCHLPP